MTTDSTKPSLRELALSADFSEASLLAGLMSDPTTARLIVAWRQSVHDLEAARQAAAAAGADPALLDSVRLTVRVRDEL